MIKDIYKKLLNSFGNQGWWPVTPENGLKPVYHYKKPLSEKQKLEIWFGVILLNHHLEMCALQ